MPGRPARATQADIARALRAAGQAGARVTVEIAPDGTIRLVPLDEPRQAEREPARVAEDDEIVL